MDGRDGRLHSLVKSFEHVHSVLFLLRVEIGLLHGVRGRLPVVFEELDERLYVVVEQGL